MRERCREWEAVATAKMEDFHRLAQKFFALVTEEFFRLGIDQGDVAGGMYDDHGIRSRFEQGAELVFGPSDFAGMGRRELTTSTVGGHEWVREYRATDSRCRSPVHQHARLKRAKAQGRCVVRGCFCFSRKAFRSIKDAGHLR